MKLFLAWCETKDHWNIVIRYWTNNLLFSNYHRWKIDVNELRKANADIIMDSWLFTMMFGAWKWKQYTEKDLWEYMVKYINDMKDMWWYWTIVEMDVHKILWLQSLEKFRKYFEDNYNIEKVMFVYHIEEWIEWLKKLAKKYPYIALSVPELRIVYPKKTNEAIWYFLNIIKKANPKCKVHLLWCTSVDLLKRTWYYSCDSSSWLGSWRFWVLSLFVNWKLKNIWNKITYDIQKLLNKFNIISTWKESMDCHSILAKQYTLMEKYINQHYFNS